MTIHSEEVKHYRNDIFFCPKCESHDIHIEDVTPIKSRRISIDDLEYYSPIFHAMDPWMGQIIKATCKACDYSVTIEKQHKVF